MKEERKYNKGQNSKIQRILERIDHLETLLLKLIKAFHIPEYKPALTRDEISFVGESSDEGELGDGHPFLSKNY